MPMQRLRNDRSTRAQVERSITTARTAALRRVPNTPLFERGSVMTWVLSSVTISITPLAVKTLLTSR